MYEAQVASGAQSSPPKTIPCLVVQYLSASQLYLGSRSVLNKVELSEETGVAWTKDELNSSKSWRLADSQENDVALVAHCSFQHHPFMSASPVSLCRTKPCGRPMSAEKCLLDI